jgi:hypothetical protein
MQKQRRSTERRSLRGKFAFRGRYFLKTKSQHRILFFRFILLKFGRRRRVDIDRSIGGGEELTSIDQFVATVTGEN